MLLFKIKDLALKPKESWEAIAQEEMTEAYLMKEVLFTLAALMAAGQFLGHWLIGTPVPRILGGGVIRLSFFAAFFNAIIWVVLNVAGVWLFSKVLNFLAPRFDAAADELNALKLSIFSMAPYLAAGLLFIFPPLNVVIILIGIYCIYLFYIGLPMLMGVPKDKALAYTIVSVLTLLVIYLIVILISTPILGALGPNL